MEHDVGLRQNVRPNAASPARRRLPRLNGRLHVGLTLLAIFVIAMVLTPADPYSMMLMAVPLCLLYLIGIGMCLWMPRGRNPFAEAYEV